MRDGSVVGNTDGDDDNDEAVPMDGVALLLISMEIMRASSVVLVIVRDRVVEDELSMVDDESIGLLLLSLLSMATMSESFVILAIVLGLERLLFFFFFFRYNIRFIDHYQQNENYN